MACGRRRPREDGGAEPDVATGPRLQSPHFFKIILPDTLQSVKLGIPKKFLGRYGKDLSSLVLLMVPGSLTWTIEIEKCNDDAVWLWKGWREFMQHYSIGDGHLIVFKYKGNSTFSVIIFNKSASEIDYSSSSISNLGSGFILPNQEDVVEVEDSVDSAPRQKMSVEPHSPCSQLSPSCSSQDLEDEVGRSTSRASHSKPVFGGSTTLWPLSSFELASEFDSECPFFKVVMRPSYIKNEMYVPRRFIMQHILEIKEIATLRHSDRSWPVKLRRCPHSVRGASFSSGWDAFVRETRLLVGNVCVFELIDRDDVVFRVHIFSSAGRYKRSKCRVDHHEPVFHDPTPPRLLTTPELAREFDSEHPFFKLVIRQCHLKKLTFHNRFIRQHMQENKGTATLRYSDRSWLVKLLRWKKERAAFSAGWSTFATETHLRVGNACVFELIDREDNVFKVSIFSNGGRGQIHIN
ncbi:B3 domain-containing transcription factor VRN1-like [Rhodamnia argentea]|uniref:B3 domain-containing transcription factor VRN1-like n=1 Tax=Rhodamnia argentea TaxID=178133 RepID=A0A8B8N683_9MYRT|nr:B3 domain-containing transcription factor VRN1-like [Rhodamnia argentea]